MRPIDCIPADWPLYYQHTFMLHNEHGLVNVTLDEEGRFNIRGEKKLHELVAPETLNPCWPQAGAINDLVHGGLYVGRGARREARRSATIGHYPIMWPAFPGVQANLHIMKALLSMQPYPTLEGAFKMVKIQSHGVAITRDLIITRHARLVYRGVLVGDIEAATDGYIFVPDVPDSPLARRVQFKLDKEGILC